jgi:hypothetical protein
MKKTALVLFWIRLSFDCLKHFMFPRRVCVHEKINARVFNAFWVIFYFCYRYFLRSWNQTFVYLWGFTNCGNCEYTLYLCRPVILHRLRCWCVLEAISIVLPWVAEFAWLDAHAHPLFKCFCNSKYVISHEIPAEKLAIFGVKVELCIKHEDFVFDCFGVRMSVFKHTQTQR